VLTRWQVYLIDIVRVKEEMERRVRIDRFGMIPQNISKEPRELFTWKSCTEQSKAEEKVSRRVKEDYMGSDHPMYLSLASFVSSN